MVEEINTNQFGINPWLRIWFYPRQTIRAIIDHDPKYGRNVLAILIGVFNFLEHASKQNLGNMLSLAWIILLSLILGPVIGLLAIYVTGKYMRWVGSLLGGKSKEAEIRAVVAWAAIPDALLMLIYIPIIAIYKENLFTSNWLIDDNLMLLISTSYAMIILGIIALIWKIILFVACFAEVHHFSILRSILASALGFAIVFIPMLLLTLGQKYLPILFP